VYVLSTAVAAMERVVANFCGAKCAGLRLGLARMVPERQEAEDRDDRQPGPGGHGGALKTLESFQLQWWCQGGPIVSGRVRT